MVALTHVCMWTDKGWSPITAEKAAFLHPKGKVSAYSGLFMCELCGQYVTLTDGTVQTRHFRHSAAEKSKNCPERISSAAFSITYDSKDHDLPIRISDIKPSSFSFKLGLIRVPIEYLNKDFRIKITPCGSLDASYTFNKERISPTGTTYLPIGSYPYESYELKLQNGNDELYNFWPQKIKGIDPEGTLFDKASGKKLTYDADVEINKEYYLLKRGTIAKRSYSSISVIDISKKQFYNETWNLYIISASDFSETAARFFLDFHCRLTDRPVSLQPIWPLFTEESYLIKHSQDIMYMLVSGNVASVQTFPSAQLKQLNHHISSSKLYEVQCSSRQQLLSAGRTQALQYTYFWKEPLNQLGQSSTCSVSDLKGNKIEPGTSHTLPFKHTLRFESNFDGEIIISKDRVIDKRKLFANNIIEVDELSYGTSLQLFIGLDEVWKTTFINYQDNNTDDESLLLKRLSSTSGVLIPAPHALRNILVGMSRYPKICKWIQKCIHNGAINEQAYRRLQEIYRSISTNKHGA